jgi:hypothetical protein
MLNSLNTRFFLMLVRLLFLATLAALAGCRLLNANPPHGSLAANTRKARVSDDLKLGLMPDLTTTDLDTSGRQLLAAGLAVYVKQPQRILSRMGRKRVELPNVTRPFKPAEWNHMIAAQRPPPGTRVRPGAQVTLTAGIHHGAGPFRPWLEAHGGAVARVGEMRCRNCHPQTYCTDCHGKSY